MASFVLSFFPFDVLDEIWDLIESVSEGFLTCSIIILCEISKVLGTAVLEFHSCLSLGRQAQ